MATKKWVDTVRPAARHFLLSAIPVQKVHKWGRRLGVATDALNTLCLRLITHETLGMILYVSMRCARDIPGGGNYRVMRPKRYHPAKVESTVMATILCMVPTFRFYCLLGEIPGAEEFALEVATLQ